MSLTKYTAAAIGTLMLASTTLAATHASAQTAKKPNILIISLRSDPFERASEDASLFYGKWKADRAFLLVPAQAIVASFLETFDEFAAAARQLQHRPGGREGASEGRHFELRVVGDADVDGPRD
jgi:hypothetical protein